MIAQRVDHQAVGHIAAVDAGVRLAVHRAGQVVDAPDVTELAAGGLAQLVRDCMGDDRRRAGGVDLEAARARLVPADRTAGRGRG